MSAIRITIEPINEGDVVRVTGKVPPLETEKEERVYIMDTSLVPVTPPLVIELEGGEKLSLECEMLQKHVYDKEQFAAVKIPPDTTLPEYKAKEGERNVREAKERDEKEEKDSPKKAKAKEPFPGSVGGAKDSHEVKGEASPRESRR
jgi:hypothetical protein